ncbi:unnamed protein product, partial [Cladocopium goreaui]
NNADAKRHDLEQQLEKASGLREGAAAVMVGSDMSIAETPSEASWAESWMDVSDSPMSPETPPSAHGRWLPGGVRVPSTPPELLLNLPGTPPGTPRWLPGGVRVPSTPPEGQPHTLFLFRLKPKATTARAPGPGPIRKRDWKPLAWKLLKDRSIILHTDGAKAYELAVPGVLHDNIVHKKKRIMVAGWISDPDEKDPRCPMDLLVQQEERMDFDRYHAEGAAVLSKVRIVPKEVRALHVMEKKDTTQQRGLMTAAEARDRLTALLLQKEELREHQMAQRSQRAVRHNEFVADKVPQLPRLCLTG